MIIGINTLFMIPNKVGGTEYHLRSFIAHLEKISSTDTFIIFCNKENAGTFTFRKKNWKKIVCPVSAENRVARLLFEQLVFPLYIYKFKCELIHSFGYFGPLWGSYKKVVTVHDTNWKDFPEDTSYLENVLLNFLISQSIARATAVLSDSHFSQERLLHYFPEAKEKAYLSYPGIETDFKKAVTKKKNTALIKNKYVLCVSAFYPHKKIPYFISVWKEVVKNQPHLNLVLIGRHGLDEEKIKTILEATKNVQWFPKVSYPQLIEYYKSALCFVFPSVYEGFGYPVYEALTAGLPTLVGKKKLYHPKVQKNLFELQFNTKKDAQQIIRLAKKKHALINVGFLDYSVAAQKLLQLYHSL